jgi:hypothetical protein
LWRCFGFGSDQFVLDQPGAEQQRPSFIALLPLRSTPSVAGGELVGPTSAASILTECQYWYLEERRLL